MRAKNKLVPKLRFPEFKNFGEWEEKILSEISPSIFDGTHQTPTYKEEGVPFFSVENIISGNKNKFISIEDHIAATAKNKPEKGDIIITRIGNIGSSKIVDWDYEFSIYVTLAIVKKSNEFNSYYLHSYFQSNRYQYEIQSKSLLNAVPCKINMDELRKTKVLLPPDKEKKEQQKIADCLSSLDDLITAENQKLEKLKSHKKGLMQNLFPNRLHCDSCDEMMTMIKEKNHSPDNVPNLRFKEFENSGEWEEKRLDEICAVNPASDRLSEHFIYIDIESVENGVLLQKKYMALEDAPSRAQRRLKSGDVIFQMVRPYQKNNFIFYPDDDLDYVASTGYAQLRAYESEMYLYQYLHNENFVNKVLAKCTGSNYPAINSNQLAEILVAIPKPDEQQKIADCLSSLDDLITAQSQKIEELKEHKKGLMQGLFPKLS